MSKCFGIAKVIIATIFCLIPFLASATNTVIEFWHSEPTHDLPFLEQQFAQYEKVSGVEIRSIKIGFDDLKAELIGAAYEDRLPDMILVPADYLGSYELLKLSLIEPEDMPKVISAKSVETVTMGKTHWGVPMRQGNHLLMYYHTKRVTKPLTSMEDIVALATKKKYKHGSAIGWSFSEMFWFVPFIGAYGGWPMQGHDVTLNTPAVAKALEKYKSLQQAGVVDLKCNYTCARKRFIKGDYDYFIDGAWAYGGLHEELGKHFGVATLPSVDGHPLISMYSTKALAFPNHGLTDPAKKARLVDFFHFLTSYDFQMRWHKATGHVPSHQQAADELHSQADPNLAAFFYQLEYSKMMPIVPEMGFAWQAMVRGFGRHLMHGFSAIDAAAYMQKSALRDIKTNH
ncbi:MAG: hypothetical protein CMF25_00530 [Kangiellaceae bacterium]|nr:hypothetical protein [Kangiellaceae bacterium]|tara:strand:- start:38880 stop:40079 length:1200 start_codon:yes stop_codon:yes gene_type:complete